MPSADAVPSCRTGAKSAKLRCVDSPSRRRWGQARSVAPLALVLAAVVLIGSSCGGASSKPTKELLRSANPLTSDIYVQVRGPAGAVTPIANTIKTGAFSEIKTGPITKYGDGAAFLPPPLYHHLHENRICLFAHTIRAWESPTLQPWVGKKITISVYGKKSSLLFCRLIGGVFLGAH